MDDIYISSFVQAAHSDDALEGGPNLTWGNGDSDLPELGVEQTTWVYAA